MPNRIADGYLVEPQDAKKQKTEPELPADIGEDAETPAGVAKSGGEDDMAAFLAELGGVEAFLICSPCSFQRRLLLRFVPINGFRASGERVYKHP